MRFVRHGFAGFFLITLAALAFLPQRGPAQQQTPPDYSQSFDKTDAMIPARDGVKLHAEIYAPKNAAEPLPIILERTPYGTVNDAKGYSRKLGRYLEMIPDGYIFVFQDIRGRYGSEGKFVMQRPARNPKDATAVDEGTDTYDTIDWLVKNVPRNNGRVVLLGISYGGWLTVMGMLEPHPALKAASEQASPADMVLGDDLHHNVAFRLSYGFEYSTMMETDKTNFKFEFDRFDTYDWYLRLGPLSNANAKYIHGTLPTWNDFVEHPNYDAFWKAQAMAYLLKKPTVPNLNEAGRWDQEVFYGRMNSYELLEKIDPVHPAPYRYRPIDMAYPDDHPGGWYTWLVQDQRFVDHRPDVLSWETEELKEDVTLAGAVTAKLFASTTGSDSDWIVKLIDVYPEKVEEKWQLSGYELMIADEVFRGRFRKSFEKPEPITPGAVTPYTIDLHTANHVFKKGHRIMVHVQSTWFPIIDRNPQKFVPNIFESKDADFVKA